MRRKINLGLIVLIIINILIQVFSNYPVNDISNYLFSSIDLVKGVNPYTKDLLFYPGYAIFFVPYMLLPFKIVVWLHAFLNVFAAIFLFFLVFQKAQFIKLSDVIALNDRASPFLFLLFLYFFASPLVLTLWSGQISVIASLLLYLALFQTKKLPAIGFLGISTTLKYSLAPMFSLVLWSKKRYSVCIGAFILFVILAVLPVIFGHNLVELYSDYFLTLRDSMKSGINSIHVHGSDLVSTVFFKAPLLNHTIRISFLVVFIAALFKEAPHPRISVRLLFLAFSTTMVVSYHRLHDMVVLLPLLYVLAYSFYKTKARFHLLIIGIFILFYTIPAMPIINASHFLAQRLGESSFLIYPKHIRTFAMFPSYAVAMFLLAAYSVYLYFFADEKTNLS